MHKLKLLTAITLITLATAPKVWAAPGVSQFVTIQGKVTNTDGTNVTDGAYDFVFNAYHGATSAAASQFTESWTNAALYTSTMTAAPGLNGESLTYSSNTNEASLKVGQVLWNVTRQEPVTIVSVNNGTNVVGISPTRQAWQTTDTITNRIYVKDGVFRVALNSLNQNWGTVDFTQDTILVGINFNGDGEMKPRIQFSSVPYAQAASLLDGIDSNGFLRTNANSELLTSNTLTTTGYLDVNGDISIADTNIALDGASSNLEVTGNLTINTDDMAVIKASGNVAIGSANPGTDKLHVTGNIVATTSIAATTALTAGTTVTAGSTATYDPILISPVARGTNAYTGTLTSNDLTAARTWTLPDATGTIALTSDIPAAGAPADATYITQTANAGLSNEQALSSLATGIVQVTTSTGVLSSVTTSAGISGLLSDETGSGHLVFDTSPTIDTSLVAGTVSFDLLNTTATTINFAGAATTLNMGAGGALTRTINIGTGTGVDTIHIGDGATGADVITIGSANAGNVSVTSNATLTLHGEANSIIDFPNFDVATTGNITTSGDLLVNGDDITADGALGITGATGVTLTSTANNISLNSAGTIELQDATNVTGALTGSTTLTAGLVATYDPITISPVARGTNAYTGTLTSVDLTAARTWTLPDASVTLMGNPMTTAGDILYGGASGTPTRLAGAGTDGHVLKYNTATNVPYWAADIDTDTNTTYSAGNDIDFSGTQIDLEPTLNYVTTITRASSDLTLSTTTSGNIILSAADHVGIGTTSPVSDLELATDSTAATRGLTLTQAGATYAAKAVFRKSEGTLTAPTTVASGDYVGAFGFMPYTTTSGFIQTAGFGTYVNGTVTGTAAPTDMYFYTGSVDNTTPLSNGAVRLYLESGGDVGIGTTNPAAKLEVTGDMLFSSGASRSLQIGSNALATGHSLTIYPGDSTAAGAVGGNLVLRGSNATGAAGSVGGDIRLYGGTGEGSDGNIILGHSGTAAIGNVGIGTTNPGQKLTIDGTLGILEGGATPSYHTIFQGGDQAGNITYTLPATSANGLLSNNAGTLSWSTANYLVNPMTTTGDIIYGGASGAPTRLAGSSGFLKSTGASAPAWSALADADVPDTITLTNITQITNRDHGSLTGLTDDDHSIYARLAGRSSGQTLIGGTGTTDDLILRTTAGVGTTGADMLFQVGNNGGTEAMRILNSGNVGIGTTNPGALLDVNGMLYVGDIQTRDDAIEINQHGTGNRFAYIDFHGDDTYTDYGFRILRYNTGANTGTDLINRGTGNLSLVTYEAGDINFKTTNTTRMTIAGGGYVGIGTTNPTTSLVVEDSSSGSIGLFYNSATSTANSDVLALNIADATNSVSHVYLNALKQGTSIGGIRNNGTGGAVMVTGAIDYAEYMDTDLMFTAGEMLGLDSKGKIIPASAQNVVGFVSTAPGFLGGENKTDRQDEHEPGKVIVAMVGQVPVIVDTSRGNIQSGDPIGTSEVNVRVGAKQVAAGSIGGRALEAFTPTESSCTPVTSYETIPWPEKDPYNLTKTCYQLPNGTYVGKVMLLLGNSWYDPNIYLSSSGEVQISGQEENYTVTAPQQGVISRIGTFAEAVIGKLKVGSFTAKEASVEKLTVNNRSVEDLVAEEVNKQLAAIPQVTTILPTPTPTPAPTPQPVTNDAVNVLSTRVSVLEMVTAETTASVAGIMTELAVSPTESRLTGLENLVASLSAYLTGEGSSSLQTDLTLPIEASVAALASGSAALNPLDIAAALTDVAISPDMIHTNFLAVMDQAVMPNLYVSTINPMADTLEIMSGLLTLNTSGQVTIAGNLKVTGLTELAQLTVNEASISGTLSAPVIDELASKSAFLEQYVASLSAELISLKTQLASPAAEASTAAVATPSARLSYFSQ